MNRHGHWTARLANQLADFYQITSLDDWCARRPDVHAHGNVDFLEVIQTDRWVEMRVFIPLRMDAPGKMREPEHGRYLLWWFM